MEENKDLEQESSSTPQPMTKADEIKQTWLSPDFTPTKVMTDKDLLSTSVMQMSDAEREDLLRSTGVYASTGQQVSTAIENALTGMNQLGDELMISFGNVSNYITGGAMGKELQDIAYDSMARRYEYMAMNEDAVGGIRSELAQLAGGATSFLQLALEGLATGGYLSLAHIGAQSFGEGTYNDMKAYADKHDGSLEGYKPQGVDLAINTANAIMQVATEEILGVGRVGFIKSAALRGGVKEALGGFIQESVQGALADLAEAMKGNEEYSILLDNIDQYVRDGIIGGVLQGPLGAASYHHYHAKATNTLSGAIAKARGHETPTAEDQQQAEDIISANERGYASAFVKEFKAAFDASTGEGQLQANIAKAINDAIKAKELDLGIDDETKRAQRVEQIATQETLTAMEMATEQNKSVSEMGISNIVYKDGAIWVEGLKPEVGERAVEYASVLAARQTGLAEAQTKLDNIQQELQQTKKDLAEAKAQSKQALADKLQARLEKQTKLAEKRRLQTEQLKAQTDKIEAQIAKQFNKESAELAGAVKSTENLTEKQKTPNQKQKTPKSAASSEQKPLANVSEKLQKTEQPAKSLKAERVGKTKDADIERYDPNKKYNKYDVVKIKTQSGEHIGVWGGDRMWLFDNTNQAQQYIQKAKAIKQYNDKEYQEQIKANTTPETAQEIETATKDVESVKGATQAEFDSKVDTENLTSAEKSKRYGNAVLKSILPTKTMFDAVMVDPMYANAKQAIIAVADRINSFIKAHRTYSLKTDISNALQKMQTVNQGNFIDSVTTPALDGQDVIAENAFLYHFLFSDATTIQTYLDSYITRAEESLNSKNKLSKKDLVGQAFKATDNAMQTQAQVIGAEYTSIYNEDGSYADKNVMAVMLSYQNQFVQEQGQQIPEYKQRYREQDKKDVARIMANAKPVTVDQIKQDFQTVVAQSDKAREQLYATGDDSGFAKNTQHIYVARAGDGAWYWRVTPTGRFEQINKYSNNNSYAMAGSGYSDDVNRLDEIVSKIPDIRFYEIPVKDFENLSDEFLRRDYPSQILEQFDLADENARLDDIYPEYKGETINIDGKERSVYNSNGERIAKSEEALRNFYKWFGDSKVVDEQGRPLVVYHGSRTEQDFDTFDKRHQLNKKTRTGFWFGTENIDYGKNVKSVYLKLENPFVFDAKKSDYYDLPTDNKKLVQDVLHSVFGDNYSVSEKETLLSDYLTIYAKNQNNDGVIIRDVKEGNTHILMDDFVAFESTQIKSVDNRGTYSADTGNILKQSKVEGTGSDKYRGGYDEKLKRIVLSDKSDLTTIQHEFAHYWLQNNFKWARSGLASPEWLRKWRDVEEALGIEPQDRFLSKQASEKFARAYERFIMEGKYNDDLKWAFDGFKEFYDETYEDLKNEYFDLSEELDPAIVDWFNRQRPTTEKALKEQAYKKVATVAMAQGAEIVDQVNDDVYTVSSMNKDGEIETKIYVSDNETQDSKLVKYTGKKKERSMIKGLQKINEGVKPSMYREVTKVGTVENARNWVESDYNGAWQALNDPSTKLIDRTALYQAFKDYAEDGHPEVALDLVNVELTKEMTDVGQAMAMLSERSEFDPMNIIDMAQKALGEPSVADTEEETADMHVEQEQNVMTEEQTNEVKNQTECKL